MLYLAVAQALALVVALGVVAALSHRISAQSRSHARREDTLLDRLMYATGKTWNTAPAETHSIPDRDEEPRAWTATPEQMPV